MSKELASNPELLTKENSVLSLMEGFTGHGRVVYLDNFYTTPQLATRLLDIGTPMVRTDRPKRKNFLTDLAKARPERGQSIFYVDEKKSVLAVQYRALAVRANIKPKIDFLLSTCHKATIENTDKQDRIKTNLQASLHHIIQQKYGRSGFGFGRSTVRSS